MEATSEWVVRVNEEAQNVKFTDKDDTTSRLNKCSIYKLPAKVVNLNREAYLPQWVSLGPYHHGEEHLKPMEEHKHRALLYALKRSNQKLECFVRVVEEVVDDLLDSYQSIDPYWQENRDAFVRLMILDGCFMLEILRKEASINDYPPNDPIFGKHGDHHVLPYIRRDMIMLENQLPFLLLEKLGAVEKEDVKFVSNLVLEFYASGVLPASIMDGCLHMVHLYKRGMVWQPNPRASDSSERSLLITGYVGSAMENNQAGITFMISETENLIDVSFSNGILSLPNLIIDETSESVFLNVLAFERFHVGAGSEVTSYVHFMSSLIKDVRDVGLLRSQGIIINNMGNDTTVVQLFNSLSKDMAFDPDNNMYEEVTSKLFNYRFSGWARFRSSLIDTYIREWPVLSAIAAASIFILTITQTVYTVYSAYHNK